MSSYERAVVRDELEGYVTAALGMGPYRIRERECLVEICGAIRQLMVRLGYEADVEALIGELADGLEAQDA